MKYRYDATRLSLIAFMTLAAASAGAECDPPGMYRIVSANSSPGIARDSFAAKPKLLYRAGNGRVRLEEAADPVNSLHLLFVTNAPDIWVVNRAEKSGKHMVDEGASKTVHVPALDSEPPEGMPPAWVDIEFGCEMKFFTDHQETQVPLVSNKREMTKHQLSEGEWRVTLVTERGSDVPWALVLVKSEQVVYSIRYLAYEHRDEVDASLFAKPEGIAFQEP